MAKVPAQSAKKIIAKAVPPKAVKAVAPVATELTAARKNARKSYVENREQVLADSRSYYERNKPAILARIAEWRARTENGKNPLYKQGHEDGHTPTFARLPRLRAKNTPVIAAPATATKQTRKAAVPPAPPVKVATAKPPVIKVVAKKATPPLAKKLALVPPKRPTVPSRAAQNKEGVRFL